MNLPKDKTKILTGLTVCHLFNDLYNWALPPLLPAVIKTFNLTHSQVGFLSSMSIFIQAVLQPTLGYFADLHRKRKAMLIAGFVLYAIGIASLGLASNYWIFFLLCLIIGVGGSTYHPQSANFLSKNFQGIQGKAQGIHGIGGSLGFYFAPIVITLLVERFGWRLAVMWLILPILFIVPFLSKLLKEPEAHGHKGFVSNLPPSLILLSIVYGLDSMVHSGFSTFLPTYYVEKGAGLSQAGFLTSYMFLAGLIAQPVGGMLFDKFGGRFVFVTSFGFLTLFIFAFLSATGVPALLLSICVGFFTLSLFPVGMAFAAALTKGERVGTTVGLVFGSAQVFSSFSPTLVGRLADHYGLGKAFFALVAVAFLGMILSLFLPAQRKATKIQSPSPTVASTRFNPSLTTDNGHHVTTNREWTFRQDPGQATDNGQQTTDNL
jgi:FSR family fosmidomycin resistance protein-like MFS transporter